MGPNEKKITDVRHILVRVTLAVGNFRKLLQVIVESIFTSERAQRAREVFRRIAEIYEYQPPVGRPWSSSCRSYISATTEPIHLRSFEHRVALCLLFNRYRTNPDARR